MDPLVQRTDLRTPSADQWRHRRPFRHPLAPGLDHMRYRPERVCESAYLEDRADLARLQRRRVRRGNKYLGFHLRHEFANIRRPPIEFVGLLSATTAIRRTAITPEGYHPDPPPHFGVPESPDRTTLQPA